MVISDLKVQVAVPLSAPSCRDARVCGSIPAAHVLVESPAQRTAPAYGERHSTQRNWSGKTTLIPDFLDSIHGRTNPVTFDFHNTNTNQTSPGAHEAITGTI